MLVLFSNSFGGIEQQLTDDEYNNSNNNTILKREIEK
jgi:hypothetical protein